MKRDDKKKIIKKFAKHDGDTGSSQVQVAILTERINALTDHLAKHPKDNFSRRGLLQMVGKRRKLLNGLRMNDGGSYESLVDKLKLRK